MAQCGPNAKSSRYQMLDSTRGLACLIVVAVHANKTNTAVSDAIGLWGQAGNLVGELLQRGWVAVPMFFVISGYGISQAVDDMRRNRRPARKFIARRFMRLFPPYLASVVLFTLTVLIVDLVASISLADNFIHDPTTLSAAQWIGNYSLTETWRHHFMSQQSTLLAEHYWTLHYEQQFYVIVALILLFAREKYFSIVALVTVAVAAIQFSPSSIRSGLEGFIIQRNWLAFAFGVLAYWQATHAMKVQKWLCNSVVLTVALYAAMGLDLDTFLEWSPRAALAFTAGFSLAIANLIGWDSRISGMRLLRPLAVCGTISYSIYLTHPLVVRAAELVAGERLEMGPTARVLVVVPVVVLLSIGAGRLFYWAAERPLTRQVSSRSDVTDRVPSAAR